MDDIGGGKMVKAYVPLAEMFGYSTDLRSKTQGRGNYSMFFEKYEPVPKNVSLLSNRTSQQVVHKRVQSYRRPDHPYLRYVHDGS